MAVKTPDKIIRSSKVRKMLARDAGKILAKNEISLHGMTMSLLPDGSEYVVGLNMVNFIDEKKYAEFRWPSSVTAKTYPAFLAIIRKSLREVAGQINSMTAFN